MRDSGRHGGISGRFLFAASRMVDLRRMKPAKRTKIVCTIGPASRTPETLEKLIRAGMNVARLNFSHGTYDEHAAMIADIRAAAKKVGEPVALLQDLQGPKVRVGVLPKEGIVLEAGQWVVFSTDQKTVATASDGKSPARIPVGYEGLHGDVKKGDRLLLDDGLMEVRVEHVDGRDIACIVIDGGTLTSHKGINVPTATLAIPAITEKDKADLKFGISQKVDWVALSFVRHAGEVEELRKMIAALEPDAPQPARIISKIEKHEAVANIDEVIAASDAIMVARGDLGIETPAEEVPLVQKMLIDKCRAVAKPVIVATQMLDSMIRNPRPTRAEVSDVANAVIDHTDATMLSGESASGKYPVEAVETMARIIIETEASAYDDVDVGEYPREFSDGEEAMADIATVLSRGIDAKAVVAASITGSTGRIVSRLRPELPIAVATPHERVCRQLNLSWGVVPFVLPMCASVEELVQKAFVHLKKTKLLKKGDKAIVVAGEPVGEPGAVNVVELRDVT
jgi:pyruvate kinase